MQVLGDLLTVDLSLSALSRSCLDAALVPQVLGGRGLNGRWLLERVGPDVDPLSPQNPLLISAGLLTGSAAPSSSRVHVSARSPHTGLLGSSSVGGTVGPALHGSGLQSVIVLGQAPQPTYLYVGPEGSELRDAGHLWGLETDETATRLFDELGDRNLAMLIIGPAGERSVPLSCIVTQRGHAAGRTGMGAVMGSKRLKAVVFRKVKERSERSPEIKAAVSRYLTKITGAPNYADKAAHGTSSAINWTDDMGMLGTHNYAEVTFAGAAAIDGTRMDPWVVRHRACPLCPVHCKAELRIDSGPYAGLEAERPDLEPLAAWGAKCGLDDPAAVIYLHHLCDRLGLDSVSAGNTVAFAMELFEKGILTAEDAGGLDLTWGNVAAMEALVRDMALARGLGGGLGNGVREAARRIGRGADKYAYHVKGLELTAFDPRGAQATGLGYAVSNRGGDFTSVYARHEWSLSTDEAEQRYGDSRAADRLSSVGKAEMVRRSMAICAVVDSLGICKVPALTLVNEFDLVSEAELVRAITGIELSPADLLLVGERILTMERIFNLRFGATGEDDELPEFFLDGPIVGGSAAGATIDLQFMLREFYEAMGWSPDGVPTAARLTELGLDMYNDEVERVRS